MKQIIELKKQIDELLKNEFQNVKPISLMPKYNENNEDWLYDCPVVFGADKHGMANMYHIIEIEKHGDNEPILIAENSLDRGDVEEFYFSELSTENKIQLLEYIKHNEEI